MMSYDELMECRKCKSVFRSSNEYRSHFEPSIKCKYCDLQVSDHDFKDHRLNCGIRCDICNRVYKRTYYFQHRLRKHGKFSKALLETRNNEVGLVSGPEMFKCESCHTNFKLLAQLQSHRCFAHKQENTVYKTSSKVRFYSMENGVLTRRDNYDLIPPPVIDSVKPKNIPPMDKVVQESVPEDEDATAAMVLAKLNDTGEEEFKDDEVDAEAYVNDEQDHNYYDESGRDGHIETYAEQMKEMVPLETSSDELIKDDNEDQHYFTETIQEGEKLKSYLEINVREDGHQLNYLDDTRQEVIQSEEYLEETIRDDGQDQNYSIEETSEDGDNDKFVNEDDHNPNYEDDESTAVAETIDDDEEYENYETGEEYNYEPETNIASTYECKECRETFQTQQDFYDHFKAKTKCKSCDFALSDHNSKDHKNNCKIKCSICNKKYTRNYLWQHRLRVHGPETYKCDNCHATFKWLNQFKKHKCYEDATHVPADLSGVRFYSMENGVLTRTTTPAFIQTNMEKKQEIMHDNALHQFENNKHSSHLVEYEEGSSTHATTGDNLSDTINIEIIERRPLELSYVDVVVGYENQEIIVESAPSDEEFDS